VPSPLWFFFSGLFRRGVAAFVSPAHELWEDFSGQHQFCHSPQV